MPHVPASTALDHIRVLDLTRVRSGPTCVRQLADWGADVIKVEMPEALEADGALGAKRHTADFQNLQRNKRSLTLNMKDPDGVALLKKLVKSADVVVENFRPDVKHRLGIDYDSLAAVNPAIILASISGFGQDGPYMKRPGFDQIAQGLGGLMSITGEPGRGPMRVGIPIADLTSGLFAAQWVQSSLLQSQIFMLDFQAARYLVHDEIPEQAGNNHPTSIPTGVFKTKDGHINIAAAGNTIWERLCDALDKPEWKEDPRFLDNADRLAHRDLLNDMIEELTPTRTSKEWIDLFATAGVPSGHIYNVGDMFADEQVKHLGIATDIETTAFGKTQLIAQPIHMSRTPSELKVSPPERGEHSDEILESLGLSADEIADLRSRNVV